jgi:N-acetylglucosamine-6-phosphate deacetylase
MSAPTTSPVNPSATRNPPPANPASFATSLFDLQVNGFAGVDFQTLEVSLPELRRAVDALRACQTHRFLLTFITDEIDALLAKFKRIEELRAQDPIIAETICGYHLEGPFLSAEDGYRGAHPAGAQLAPDWAAFQRLQAAAGGRIKLLTIAPELPGSAEFIAEAAQAGVVVSLGHTNATDAQIDAAIRAGAKLCTHLGNGVPQTLHRHDNVMQRLLARDELTACFIPDGVHLPPAVLRNFFRAKPRGKVLFTTDAVSAAGAPPGRYTVGSIKVESKDGVVRQPGRKNFAGSCLTPDQGVTNAARWLGISMNEARAMFSTQVAAHFGVGLPIIPMA